MKKFWFVSMAVMHVCPEIEKGWLLGKEPIISVRAKRSFSKGNNPVSKKLRLSGLARHACPLDKR